MMKHAGRNLVLRVPETSTPFEFILETGLGVHYFVTDPIIGTMGVRLHHISNANLGDQHTGINGIMPYIEISFFRPVVFC